MGLLVSVSGYHARGRLCGTVGSREAMGLKYDLTRSREELALNEVKGREGKDKG
jgi:hypothetical protein